MRGADGVRFPEILCDTSREIIGAVARVGISDEAGEGEGRGRGGEERRERFLSWHLHHIYMRY